jgi:hypothetical protein
VTTGDFLKLGVSFGTIVGICTLAGRLVAGLIAIVLGKNEDLWMRRGEMMFGCVGLGGWIAVAIATLSQ